MTQRVAILISGGGSNMRALVSDMTGDHPARPCVVLSNTAEAGGIAWARAQGIATEVVDHRPFAGDRAAFEAALQAALAPHDPQIICLAGFMRKLTAGFTDAWAGRMINIHPSLLPLYRGLNTHARAIEAGDREHGCTVHEVTAALDDGPILGQARVPVLPDDTPDTLAARVLTREHQLYPAVLRRFAAGDRRPVNL
ncbi:MULTISPECIES: phosphoribosylglycinamide formyltransferase [unclassified Sulfitobacter]|uniref:phosphoribosylglycinamide formyltransferase n=1 Tax=unclassified Sulfitobacter TaxID=196795 RepID=UPI0007C316DF|nr:MULTISPECIES: phosphoribosylglycinamide formyltransferase [unclassified Sulfitobacter]KZX99150.1 phosphoribosylglycinamide formyltransferase [Sulfitobacter sp. HI0023]KZY22361.1 phosphoribosylglycinamide formyltransferase [Sulfitobacter sp. HI0040]KZZ67310.1 phosphoribosylglycinamide formyltransferase [Sulfitobacter sp. HI0129]